MRVHITRTALNEIEMIGDYIAEDNPLRAASFVDELLLACKTLNEHPDRFALVPRFGDLAIRRRVHGTYAIFYRVRADKVIVYHVVHGAMNYDDLLFSEN